MSSFRAPCILALVVTAAACADAPERAVGIGDAVLAAGGSPGGGGGSTSTDQPVSVVWDDNVNGGWPGIASDGRGAYETDVCGVYTSFDTGSRSSGHLTADYDYGHDGSGDCGPRYLVFDFGLGHTAPPSWTAGGILESAPKHVVREIGLMAAGESRVQWIGFGIQQENCGRVLFDESYSGSSSVLVTRLSDVGAARQWRVETQSPHTGLCVVAGKGNKFEVKSGPYYMPFAFTITEVK